jgi:hypothetical protein
MPRFLLSLAVLGLLTVAIGCGGSSFPDPVAVTGTINRGGSPVADAKVTFLPKSAEGRSASGVTNAEGKFTLTTFNTGDGALPGDYTVTILKVDPNANGGSAEIGDDGEVGADYGAGMDGAATDSGGATESLLPAKYADAAQSGLDRTVAASGPANDFTIDIVD